MKGDILESSVSEESDEGPTHSNAAVPNIKWEAVGRWCQAADLAVHIETALSVAWHRERIEMPRIEYRNT